MADHMTYSGYSLDDPDDERAWIEYFFNVEDAADVEEMDVDELLVHQVDNLLLHMDARLIESWGPEFASLSAWTKARLPGYNWSADYEVGDVSDSWRDSAEMSLVSGVWRQPSLDRCGVDGLAGITIDPDTDEILEVVDFYGRRFSDDMLADAMHPTIDALSRHFAMKDGDFAYSVETPREWASEVQTAEDFVF